MNRVLLLPFLVAPLLTAQGDRIQWTDGSVTESCRITQFTVFEIKFTSRGNSETRSADQVAAVGWEKLDEWYRRATGAPLSEAPGEFLNEANKRLAKKDFLTAQIGFERMARLYAQNGQMSDAVAALQKLTEEIPDSGYAPEFFRLKLDYYLSQGKDGAKNAAAAANSYRETAVTKAWPKGFMLEASFYEVMAGAAAGTTQPADLERQLRGVLGSAEGVAAGVARRAKLQIARMLLLQDKLEDASKIYEDLADQRGLDQNSQARMWIDMGQIKFKRAAADDKDAFRKALLLFLRAYLDAPEASNELRAEGAFYAAAAAEKWAGPDARLIQGRMRAILRRDFAETSWAKR